MSYIFNYFNSFFQPQPLVQDVPKKYHTTNIDNDFSIVDDKYLISKDDLIKVNLKPVITHLDNKFNLRDLNKAQMNMILNVKLKPTKVNEKPIYYAPKHPVLLELHQKYALKKYFGYI